MLLEAAQAASHNALRNQGLPARVVPLFRAGSLLVIAVAFLPVFTLEAQEGRLFKPLAFTKNFAMAIAAAALSSACSQQPAAPVVVVNDKFGIRLTDIVTPSERMRRLGR